MTGREQGEQDGSPRTMGRDPFSYPFNPKGPTEIEGLKGEYLYRRTL